jgi:hypothetical protein
MSASLTPARAAISLVFVPLNPFSANREAAEAMISAFRIFPFSRMELDGGDFAMRSLYYIK